MLKSLYFLFGFLSLWYPCHGMMLVINTWPWPNATNGAWQVGNRANKNTALDMVTRGCQVCQEQQCDKSVGWGGSPDSYGETTLDAMVMDGNTHKVGAVGGLRRVKDAIGVARAVHDYTTHTLLVGDSATNFASMMGFPIETLSSPYSVGVWAQWVQNNCQPNSWINIANASLQCGPYSPPSPPSSSSSLSHLSVRTDVDRGNHDTIAMVAIDSKGNIASGTSTNGLTYKIAGRVGDSPIMGAGSYADSEIGGCGSTGDGDVMMRFLPCVKAVLLMKGGMSATKAAQTVISEIGKFYPNFVGALFAVNKNGDHGGACWNWTFQYCLRTNSTNGVQIFTVKQIN